jgi:hypothetical protein
MTDSTAPSVRRRPWPSRSRISRFALAPLAALAGEAFGGAKGEPEDEEVRSATDVAGAGVVVESVI